MTITAGDLDAAWGRFEGADVDIRAYHESWGWYEQSREHPLWRLDPATDAGLAAFLEAARHAPSFMLAHAIAERLEGANRWGEALAVRAASLPSLPRWKPAWVERVAAGIASNLERLGRHGEALAFVERCLRWAPTSVTALAARAAAEISVGRPETAWAIEAWLRSWKPPPFPPLDEIAARAAAAGAARPAKVEPFRPVVKETIRFSVDEARRACVCTDPLAFRANDEGMAYSMALEMLAAGRTAQLDVVAGHIKTKRARALGRSLAAVQLEALLDATRELPRQARGLPAWVLERSVQRRRDAAYKASGDGEAPELEHGLWDLDTHVRFDAENRLFSGDARSPIAQALREARLSVEEFVAVGSGGPRVELELPPPGGARSRPQGGATAPSGLRGVALVDRALAADARPRRRPSPQVAAATLERLSFEGGAPLPDSLRRWLAHRTAPLDLEIEAEERIATGAAGTFFSRLAAAAGVEWDDLDLLLPQPCALLQEGADSLYLCYLGKRDAAGEYAVIVIDVDDAPYVGLFAPGVDVFLAERAGALGEWRRKHTTSMFSHAEYAPAMAWHARENLHGLRSFTMGEPLPPGLRGVPRRAEGPVTLPEPVVARIRALHRERKKAAHCIFAAFQLVEREVGPLTRPLALAAGKALRLAPDTVDLDLHTWRSAGPTGIRSDWLLPADSPKPKTKAKTRTRTRKK